MHISVDISMYPLNADYKPAIKQFIRDLRNIPELELVTNQLSTQITGDFNLVMKAVNSCMRSAMEQPNRVVFVARYLNAGLAIRREPDID